MSLVGFPTAEQLQAVVLSNAMHQQPLKRVFKLELHICGVLHAT